MPFKISGRTGLDCNSNGQEHLRFRSGTPEISFYIFRGQLAFYYRLLLRFRKGHISIRPTGGLWDGSKSLRHVKPYACDSEIYMRAHSKKCLGPHESAFHVFDPDHIRVQPQIDLRINLGLWHGPLTWLCDMGVEIINGKFSFQLTSCGLGRVAPEKVFSRNALVVRIQKVEFTLI